MTYAQPPIPIRNPYASGRLDRAGERRRDEAWLAERLADAATRIVALWQGQPLTGGDQGAPEPLFLAPHEVRALGVAMPALLGVIGTETYFAADLSHLEAPAAHPLLEGRGAPSDLRVVGPLLAADDANLLAYARGLVWWHQRTRFCSLCGAPTAVTAAGHVLRCTNPDCATDHFPRTDPAVIMLVHDGDRCLLGRQSRFPPGMYSTLAGFVEPGESLEDAVAREVREETGVTVGEVVYHSSQPWPFPASLMVGFHAAATSRAVRVDNDELEDARWFDRAELLAAGEPGGEPGRLCLPRRDSISRRLVEDWLGR